MEKKVKRMFIGITLLVIVILAAIMIILREPGDIPSAETSAERVAYLNSKGWIVNPESMEIREIIVPREFNEAYEEYSDLQQMQGFDLKKYRGKPLTLYTYHVLNHPDRADHVVAELLVESDRIVGGAIRCTEQGGFVEPL